MAPDDQRDFVAGVLDGGAALPFIPGKEEGERHGEQEKPDDK